MLNQVKRIMKTKMLILQVTLFYVFGILYVLLGIHTAQSANTWVIPGLNHSASL